MAHSRIINEMSKIDSPHMKIAEAYNLMTSSRTSGSYFRRVNRLLSDEILPRTYSLSPRCIEGEASPSRRTDSRSLVEIAGGVGGVSEKARRVSEALPKAESMFEQTVSSVDFAKLERRERRFGLFIKYVARPLRIAAYSGIAACFALAAMNPLLMNIPAIRDIQNREQLFMNALLFFGAALLAVKAADYLFNPALKEMREGIQKMREGLAELRSVTRDLLETTSFFRGT